MPLNGGGTASRVPGVAPAPNQTVKSADYNAEIGDIYNIFNTPRPVAYGGTGATNGTDAMANLGFYAFAAHKNGTDQTGIVSAATTKLTFGTEDYDQGGYYDTATSRFTPPAGKYRFVTSLTWSAGVVDAQGYNLQVFKNGVMAGSTLARAYGATSFGQAFVVDLDANGTDYFEVYAIGNGAGSKTISGNASATRFSASRIA